MHISLQWISEFIDIDLSSDFFSNTKQIAEQVTLGVVEVENISIHGKESLEKIEIVEVLEKVKHPNSEKLNLVTFKKCDNSTMQVVCGASNVTIGMKTPYACVNITLPTGITLTPKEIRGVVSHGMLCSYEDLGFSKPANATVGLWELPEKAIVGQNMSQFLDIQKDIILEIDNKGLTHRPDLWGHWGFAREMAIIWNAKGKNRFSDSWKKNLLNNFNDRENPIEVVNENDSALIAFGGFSMENVKVEESPNWLKTRLESMGLRPINSIVDISNYVMLEIGHALHIYDANKIHGNKLYIKKLNEDLVFTTLDKTPRKMQKEDTMIFDQKDPLIIGGIMGGVESSVTQETTKIFIECANWKPQSIRKMSSRLGLRTDASTRYEKSLDSNNIDYVLLRTMELILELNPQANVVGKMVSAGEDYKSVPRKTIKAEYDYILNLLGVNSAQLPKEKVHSLLFQLGLGLDDKDRSGDTYILPSFRATKDLQNKADIAEEIGRLIGYGTITPNPPKCLVKTVSKNLLFTTKRKIEDFWVHHAKCTQVMSYCLVGDKLHEKYQWPLSQLPLINALSVDHSKMRNSLIPNLLESVFENAKYFSSFKMFELGRVYQQDSNSFSKESEHLCVMYYQQDDSLLSKTLEQMANDFEAFIECLNIPCEMIYDQKQKESFKNPILPAQWSFNYGPQSVSFKVMGQFVGGFCMAHPYLLSESKIKGNLIIGVMDLHSYFEKMPKRKVSFKSLSMYPSVDFDTTVVAPTKTNISSIFSLLKKSKIPYLHEYKYVGEYIINENQKSITLRFTFLNMDKTFDRDEIEKLQQQVVKLLKDNGYPLKGI